MARTIAAVTIGQAPRPDVVSEMSALTPGVGWIEAGALDGFDDAALAAVEARPGDFPLVTRLRSGRTVVVGERAIAPHVEAAVRRVEGEADVVVVLCTGEFRVPCRKPLLIPCRLLTAAVTAVDAGGPVAILTPLADQAPGQALRWRERGLDAHVIVASPYADTDFGAVGRRALELGARLIVMDCLGYSVAMKTAVQSASGRPTVLVRSLVARLAAELVA